MNKINKYMIQTNITRTLTLAINKVLLRCNGQRLYWMDSYANYNMYISLSSIQILRNKIITITHLIPINIVIYVLYI